MLKFTNVNKTLLIAYYNGTSVYRNSNRSVFLEADWKFAACIHTIMMHSHKETNKCTNAIIIFFKHNIVLPTNTQT